MTHCEGCDGQYKDGRYNAHIETIQHKDGKERRRQLEWRVKEEIGMVPYATLDLFARILDGRDRATEDVIGSLRIAARDSSCPIAIARLRILVGPIP